MNSGGYEGAYSRCDCLWGAQPAALVVRAAQILRATGKTRAIDFGCGEGKNAAALAQAGFSVLGLELSSKALQNALRIHPDVPAMWVQADIRHILGPTDFFDLAVATGSLHCLHSAEEIRGVVNVMQSMTRIGGLNVISSFNDGPHSFAGHDEGFKPTLLAHSDYLGFYCNWEVVDETTQVQEDIHPHNNIPHHHSITRLLVRRLR